MPGQPARGANNIRSSQRAYKQGICLHDSPQMEPDEPFFARELWQASELDPS